jgi:hypothetical protein
MVRQSDGSRGSPLELERKLISGFFVNDCPDRNGISSSLPLLSSAPVRFSSKYSSHEVSWFVDMLDFFLKKSFLPRPRLLLKSMLVRMYISIIGSTVLDDLLSHTCLVLCVCVTYTNRTSCSQLKVHSSSELHDHFHCFLFRHPGFQFQRPNPSRECF